MRSLTVLLLLVASSLAEDILVLAPEEFHPALSAWKTHREKQGYKIKVVTPGEDPRATVLRNRAEDLRFVLLVGDVKQVPAHVFHAEIIKKWEKDPRVANDNHTADLDGDHVPDVAIGRIPADTAEEAKTMLGKVIAYENDRDFTTWRRRINVVAGVGGFGALQDAAIEAVSTDFLKNNVPPEYDLHVTYAKPVSPFCPPPAKVQEITSRRLDEGALFFVYIGHGWRSGFDRFRFKGERYPIFTEDAAWELESKHGMPIAFLLCCSTGHFDDAPDCIAEVMVKRPKGPIAVIASSRVSMPYGNAPLAKEFLQGLFVARKPTLGEAFLFAKRRLMTADKDDKLRAKIEQMAQLLYEPDPQKRRDERIEHLYLYNLLGDPSLRLPHPEKVEMSAPEAAQAGGSIRVAAKSPLGGSFRVELVEERTPIRPRRTGDSEQEFLDAYRRANDWVRVSGEGEAKDGALSVELKLPEQLKPGRYDVRVWIEGETGVAMGSRPLVVEAPEKQD